MKKEKEKVQTNIGIHEITEPSKLVTRKITGEKNNKIQFSYLCVEWTKSLHLLNLKKTHAIAKNDTNFWDTSCKILQVILKPH